MSTDMTVANEILRQLGGREFLSMTGTHSLVGSERALSMRLKRNCSPATGLTVTLNDNDLYDLRFFRVRKFEVVDVELIENVHVDDLRPIFKQTTGFELTMPRIVGINA